MTFDALLRQKYGDLNDPRRKRFHKRAYRFMTRKNGWFLSRASRRELEVYLSRRFHFLSLVVYTPLRFMKGIALTTLAKTGVIQVDGKKYEAMAGPGVIPAEAPIVVVGKAFGTLKVLTVEQFKQWLSR